MRTINTNELFPELEVKNQEALLAAIANVPDEERQPCWYIEVNKSDNRDDYSWKVGVKNNDDSDEHEFKYSEIKSDESWQIVNAPDFPLKLLKKFQEGGKKAIKDWFKNGCT